MKNFTKENINDIYSSLSEYSDIHYGDVLPEQYVDEFIDEIIRLHNNEMLKLSWGYEFLIFNKNTLLDINIDLPEYIKSNLDLVEKYGDKSIKELLK